MKLTQEEKRYIGRVISHHCIGDLLDRDLTDSDKQEILRLIRRKTFIRTIYPILYKQTPATPNDEQPKPIETETPVVEEVAAPVEIVEEVVATEPVEETAVVEEVVEEPVTEEATEDKPKKKSGKKGGKKTE